MSAAMRAIPEIEVPSIDSLCEGVERDRSHVLVLCVTPGASSADAPALLARRYADQFEVVSASLAQLEPEMALASILDDREATDSITPEARLLRRIEGLLARGSAMLLTLPDAAAIPAATLRRLGDLASASRHGLRLALFADCAASAIDALAANLVGNLGVGVEKIVVGLRPGQETGPSGSAAIDRLPEVHPAALRGPPRIEHDPLPWWARGRAIRVRSSGRRTHVRSAVWMGAGLFAALLVMWSTNPDFAVLDPLVPISLVKESRSAPDPSVDLAPPSPSPPQPAEVSVAAEATPVTHLEPTSPEATSIAKENVILIEPHPGEIAARTPVNPAPARPDLPTPAVNPVRMISVNMNAIPWAHVELDGRSIGTTPLAEVPLELGSHRLVLKFPDGRVLERTVEIDGFSRYLRFP